ncbi:MAG: TolC family protein, partial [Desulfuromonadales bacterium]
MNTPTLWMSVMRLMVLLTPFVVMVVDGTCQDKTPTITLSRTDALALAIRNNIDLQVRAIDSSLAKTDIMTSRSIYNPALSASIDYSQTNVAGEDFGTEDTSGALGLTQLLPTGATVSVSTRTGPTSAYADPLYNYTDWATAIGITIYQPLLK